MIFIDMSNFMKVIVKPVRVETHPVEAMPSNSPLIRAGFLLGCFFKAVVFIKLGIYSRMLRYNDFVKFANGKWSAGFRCALPDLQCIGVNASYHHLAENPQFKIQ